MPAEYAFDQLMGFLDLLQVNAIYYNDSKIKINDLIKAVSQ